MQGTGTLHIYDYDLLFKGLGTVSFGPDEQLASVSFAAESYFIPNGTTDYAKVWFPAFSGQSFGADTEGYGNGLGIFPAFYGGGEAVYVPPSQQYGFALVAPFWGSGVVKTSSPGEADVDFPAFIGIGGEGYYGLGYATFPPFVGSGVDDLMPGQAPVMASLYAFGGVLGVSDHIVLFNSTGQFIDTITADRQLVDSIIATLTASDNHTVLGVFSAAVDSDLVAGFSLAGSIGDTGSDTTRPAVDVGSRVWVVNADTGATSQYDGYGFNSFFSHDDQYYGVAEDGIYLLEGDTDNGVGIEAEIDFGKTTLGTARHKRVINVYAGVSSSGKMLLKVKADGREYIYEARSSSDELQNHRFDLGRGLTGGYYNFTLMNQGGFDFDLEGISFEPIILSRKI